MRTFITRGLLVATSLTLVTACGDDKKVLKKADYIKQADAICAAAEKESDGLGDPETEAEYLKLIPKAAKISIKSIEDVQALGEPDIEAAKIKKLLNDYKSVFRSISKATSIKAMEPDLEKLEELGKVADDFGFVECGHG